jgi:ABC-type nitrate/sulfonate/bicarbonate transport system substrate-binding protein
MKTITGWTIVFITAGLILLGGLTFWLWSPPSRSLRPYAGPVEKLTISTGTDAKSALLFIAQHNDYFSQNGLEVTLKILPSGKMAREQLQAGTIDIANASDFVVVEGVFAGSESLRCLGAIAAAKDILVIARKDQGILTPGDLRGKKVGVPLGTAAEFFLGRFLTFHNLSLSDVAVVNVHPADLGDALAIGSVDAVIIWERYGVPIKQRLEDQVVSWPGQSGQKYYWLLVTTDAIAKTRLDVLKRLFKALDQAENFLKSHPEEGIGIIARRINLDPAIVQAAWMKSTYALSFDQALFIMMEDEARWMIKNKLTDQTTLPNYLNYIDAEALLQVNPKAVDLIIPRQADPQ